MTIQHVYNLYDSTCETYIAQFFNVHDKLMKRDCENLYEQAKQIHLKNPVSAQGSLFRYADSYLMIHTADFDDQKGIYTMLDVPVTVYNFGTAQLKDIEKSQDMNNEEKTYSKLINSSPTNSQENT